MSRVFIKDSSSMQGQGVTLQKNIMKEAPHLNKKIVTGYQTLAGEFFIVNGEFSDFRCLMNTLQAQGGWNKNRINSLILLR